MPIHVLNTNPPICQVGVDVDSAMVRRQRGGPSRVANALIDTGANRTAVDPSLIQALGSRVVSKDLYNRPDGVRVWKFTYAVRLCFEPSFGNPQWAAEVRWFEITVASIAPATPGVQVLIGQDLLAELVPAWDGPRSRMLLMY